jgi:hypothetical protein
MVAAQQLYYDDDNPNLLTNVASQRAMTAVVVVAIVVLCGSLALHVIYTVHCAEILKYPVGSLRFELYEALFAKSLYRRMQDRLTLAILALLLVGTMAVTIYKAEHGTGLKDKWGLNSIPEDELCVPSSAYYSSPGDGWCQSGTNTAACDWDGEYNSVVAAPLDDANRTGFRW